MIQFLCCIGHFQKSTPKTEKCLLRFLLDKNNPPMPRFTTPTLSTCACLQSRRPGVADSPNSASVSSKGRICLIVWQKLTGWNPNIVNLSTKSESKAKNRMKSLFLQDEITCQSVRGSKTFDVYILAAGYKREKADSKVPGMGGLETWSDWQMRIQISYKQKLKKNTSYSNALEVNIFLAIGFSHCFCISRP